MTEKRIFFHYNHGSRTLKVALQFFRNYQGVIQPNDCYLVYDMYENKKGVLLIGGCAHTRREFDEALKEDNGRESYALDQIYLLYDVEHRADQENLTDEQRTELRSRLAYPIMVAFEKMGGSRISQGLAKRTNLESHKLHLRHLSQTNALSSGWQIEDGQQPDLSKSFHNLTENDVYPID